MRTADPQPVVFVGFDPNEIRAHNIAQWSIRKFQRSADEFDLRPLVLMHLQFNGWYTRPMSRMHLSLWDDISVAPMSTEHAISRFFVPFLLKYQGWGIFLDGDVMLRRPITELLALRDDRFAVQCVQHPPLLSTQPKKNAQIQMTYPRKNWSSVMMFNCSHPSNQRLTLDVLNSWPGRDLHGFQWLEDHEIGPLPAEWNYLVGVNEPPASPALVHYTLGTPDLPGHAGQPYEKEWFDIAKIAGFKVICEDTSKVIG